MHVASSSFLSTFLRDQERVWMGRTVANAKRDVHDITIMEEKRRVARIPHKIIGDSGKTLHDYIGNYSQEKAWPSKQTRIFGYRPTRFVPYEGTKQSIWHGLKQPH